MRFSALVEVTAIDDTPNGDLIIHAFGERGHPIVSFVMALDDAPAIGTVLTVFVVDGQANDVPVEDVR